MSDRSLLLQSWKAATAGRRYPDRLKPRLHNQEFR